MSNAISALDNLDELPLDENFVEQAEYIPEASLLALSADHPDEDSIVRRLSVGGAKLLVGPRGCGKTTLMLKAYYSLLRDASATAFPIYVNFKLSLKLEPLYINTPNAAFWFRMWLNLKVYEGLFNSVDLSGRYKIPDGFPTQKDVVELITSIESGRVSSNGKETDYTTNGLVERITEFIEINDLSRCILLLDDAAHAFSPRQQEDFFEFFRQVKSRYIAPKAAIYPGITAHSPTFHVGHDAEQIDVWIRPDRAGYVEFMRTLASRRFGGNLPASLARTSQAIEFLALASFGIPRSFLNMLRTVYHDEAQLSSSDATLDRRRVLDVSKQGRELSHSVFDALVYKLPAYKAFIHTGQDIYQKLIEATKAYNKIRTEESQAVEVGLRRPIPPEFEKVVGFLQYAGLLMPVGENSRGIKGVFDLYMIHFGDLISENAIIGRRTKSISLFVTALTAQKHQVWPRISIENIINVNNIPSLFRLSLPNCQVCGSERANEHAKFCQNCGAQLKSASLYDDLINQDISVLPLSKRMVDRIKKNSNIRKIKDILIDTDRSNLRGIKHIGPIRAARIARSAEEHVA